MIPDEDSYDDFENFNIGLPRGVTPYAKGCEPDGILCEAWHLKVPMCA